MINVAYNRDCLEAMKEMDDNHWDLAICDPPYGIGAGSERFANGSLKMTINNPACFDKFETGQEYYLDFTPAEPAEAVTA